MICDVKPAAKLQRNPQISKSLAFRTKNKYFPQGLVEQVEQVEQVETHQKKDYSCSGLTLSNFNKS